MCSIFNEIILYVACGYIKMHHHKSIFVQYPFGNDYLPGYMIHVYHFESKLFFFICTYFSHKHFMYRYRNCTKLSYHQKLSFSSFGADDDDDGSTMVVVMIYFRVAFFVCLRVCDCLSVSLSACRFNMYACYYSYK